MPAAGIGGVDQEPLKLVLVEPIDNSMRAMLQLYNMGGQLRDGAGIHLYYLRFKKLGLGERVCATSWVHCAVMACSTYVFAGSGCVCMVGASHHCVRYSWLPPCPTAGRDSHH